MVARGDLGIETSLTDLPNIQRKIMYSCAVHGKINCSNTFIRVYD